MKSKFTCFILLYFVVTSGINGQINSHYWSHQYGAKGLLLNGAVIAAVDDETAIFYNPGAMGVNGETGLSVSLITPTFSHVETTDFLGEGTSVRDQSLGLAPGLVAAMLKPFGTDRVTLGLTAFKRFEAAINFDDRVVDRLQDNSQSIFLGELDFNRHVSETWVGIGASFKLHERLSIGFTEFVTWHGQDVNLDFKKEILNVNNPTEVQASWRSSFQYGFSANAGILTKAGLLWKPFGIKVGVTYTSAIYSLLLKNASYEFDDQKVFSNGETTSASNNQDTELNDYETPWSVGFGIEVPSGKAVFSFSTEYFSGISRYNLIEDFDDPLDGLSPNSPSITTIIGQSNEPVLNVAFGYQKLMNEKYSFLLGARTDFSQNSFFDLGDGITFLSSTPDVYHLSTGIAYSYKRSLFSIGIDYGFGSNSGGQQLTDISNLSEDNIFAFSGEGSVETFSHQLALYITYDF